MLAPRAAYKEARPRGRQERLRESVYSGRGHRVCVQDMHGLAVRNHHLIVHALEHQDDGRERVHLPTAQAGSKRYYTSSMSLAISITRPLLRNAVALLKRPTRRSN